MLGGGVSDISNNKWINENLANDEWKNEESRRKVALTLLVKWERDILIVNEQQGNRQTGTIALNAIRVISPNFLPVYIAMAGWLFKDHSKNRRRRCFKQSCKVDVTL